MHVMVKEAAEHWQYVAPLLQPPQNKQEYDAKVQALDEILDQIGENEQHPLASLASHLGDLIEAYDDAHYPMPTVSGVEVFRYLVREHDCRQSDFPEIGTQSVVSEILAGKRSLTWRHICGLAERFGVSTDVFRD